MRIAFLVGRVILGLYYLFNAFSHFTQVSMMAGYATSKGVPFASAAVVGSGVFLLVGGASLLLGYRPHIGTIVMIVFLVPVTLMMHNFWTIDDAQMRMMDMVGFMKNLGLIASTLMFLAIPQPWPFSIGSRGDARR